jgi:hypothetical protein
MPAHNVGVRIFILESGATCHISPMHSDFTDFQTIPEHPITGLGGARVYAIGIGTVELVVRAVNRTRGRRLYGYCDTGSYTVACSDVCRDLMVRVWYGTTCHNPLVDGCLRAS